MAKGKQNDERENQIKSDRWNLENELYSGIAGSNELRRNPSAFGEIGYRAGESLYSHLMVGEDTQKLRGQIYENEQKRRDVLGIADSPDYPSNYAVTSHVLTTLNNSVARLPLGVLEEIVGDAVKLDIPEDLKGLTGNEEDLDEATQKIVGSYKSLAFEAYKRNLALSTMQSHAYEDITESVEKTNKAYEQLKKKNK